MERPTECNFCLPEFRCEVYNKPHNGREVRSVILPRVQIKTLAIRSIEKCLTRASVLADREKRKYGK